MTIRDAFGPAALCSSGLVRLSDGVVFVNNTAVRNFLARFGEDTVPVGTAANPPLRGACLMSTGGAIVGLWNAASLVGSDASFSENVAKGARVTHIGGAIYQLGGSVNLTKTSFRHNRVEPALLIARAGAVHMRFGVMMIDASEFVGNEVTAAARDSSSGLAGPPLRRTHRTHSHTHAQNTRTHPRTKHVLASTHARRFGAISCRKLRCHVTHPP